MRALRATRRAGAFVVPDNKREATNPPWGSLVALSLLTKFACFCSPRVRGKLVARDYSSPVNTRAGNQPTHEQRYFYGRSKLQEPCARRNDSRPAVRHPVSLCRGRGTD